ncbi:MAG: hemerythrin family protein [Gammaproteobacteria bacterium]|nr:hemerythrin family protein [Gammaproteobacteria bacterium]
MVEFIEWSDDYCVGNNLIDIQHKLFFEMVRDLSQRVKSGKRDVQAAEIVQFLNDYIDMHFSDEEKLLREIHFPDLKNHQAIHNEFSKSIQRLNRELYSEEVSYILDKILSVTQNWFLDHILTQDKEFSKYLH